MAKSKGVLKIVDRIQGSRTGRIIVSVIVALGIASLFRFTCKGDCIVIKGPPLSETKNNIYKIDDTCYKYNAVSTICKKKH
jgi:hypothetical protein